MKLKLLIMFGAILLLGGFCANYFTPEIPAQPDVKNPVTPKNTTTTKPAHTPIKADQNSEKSQNKTPQTTTPTPANIPEPLEKLENGKIIAKDGKIYPVRVYKPSIMPDDPVANQWWVGGTGLNTAWDYAAGSKVTTVAVIDTGFALKHEEFANRWYVNPGESGSSSVEEANRLNCTARSLPINQSCNLIDENFDTIVDNEVGATTDQNPSKLNCSEQGLPLDKSCNNVDDDGNGLVDDVSGWDFSNYDSSAQAGEMNPSGPGTTHATMVSGVLAATGNNGVGIAGVNWATKILPMQALDDDAYGDTLTVARSVRYAADQKVDVISISLGTDFEDPYLREAIDYAIGKGSAVVAASGNSGCDCISYPARYPEVIAVGASAPDGNPASFNSYGSELDLLAPGQGITTSTWSAANTTSAYASGVAGTSFSTPFVSGLLALAKSRQPAATWGELTAALLEQSDHKTLTPASPHSKNIGFGHARADKLMTRVTVPAQPQIRHFFGPVKVTDTLDSPRLFQCQPGDYPTSTLYELKLSGQVQYTASKLSQHKATQAGWTSRSLNYACTGLLHDLPASLRHINLLSEINNDIDRKRNY